MTLFLILYTLYALVLSIALGRRNPGKPQTGSGKLLSGGISRVLVVGAAGRTGRRIVEQALERGLEVTAFVRNPARLDLSHPRLKVSTGDVLDPASVDHAMKGQDAVLCALGHGRFFGPSRILSEGTRNIVRAMELHNVRRLVCETSLGIGSSAGRMGFYYTFFTIPVILPFYFWDKTRQEQVIGSSTVEWVIVRPGGLTNGTRKGACKHGSNIGSYIRTVRISREGVAEFMLDQLKSDRYLGTAVGVCG